MNSIVVFDIETVPDVELCKNLTGLDEEDVAKQRQAMEDYHLQITDGKNPFLRQPFHKIIVISILKASLTTKNGYEYLELKKISSGDIGQYLEPDLVKLFFDHVCKELPRLVSFNGRTFDLPVMKYRAMKYGVQAEKFYKSGDKWSCYNNRYGAEWHMDLLDILSDYGLSARVKMNEVCVAFGLPGKLGIDGADVSSLYDQGRIQDIRNYCETDVINTYLIYLRVIHHQGRISDESYKRNLNELKKYLEDFSGEKPHFAEFLSECKF